MEALQKIILADVCFSAIKRKLFDAFDTCENKKILKCLLLTCADKVSRLQLCYKKILIDYSSLHYSTTNLSKLELNECSHAMLVT